jgi:putative SOS response-associated peptidase YedK
MCGRFTLVASKDELAEEFDLDDLPADWRPRYNVAPTQEVFALLAGADGARRSGWLRWGLIPAWAKDPAIGNRMINARAETLGERPAFRNAFAKRRCLVLADSFYEWQRMGGRKVPMRIRLASGRPFAIAGIAERWRPVGGEPLESCAIITTAANPFMQPIHDRMPVILDRAARSRWLDAGASAEELHALLEAGRSSDLEAYPVSLLVNSPANDRPEVIEPLPPTESGGWDE